MMKIVLTHILVACMVICNAQTEKKIYYNKNSKVVSTIDSAASYRKVKYDKEGKPVGKIKDYYLSGDLMIVTDGALKIDSVNDHNSIFIGESISYYKSGKMMSDEKRDNRGILLSEEGFYENGKHKFTAAIVEGKINGPLIYLYEDGSKMAEMNYVNGLREGIAHWYYKNGAVSKEVVFLNDMMDGACKNYDNAGVPIDEVVYLHGRKNGLYKRYSDKGKIESETMFVNDKRNGHSKSYYENGATLVDENFVDDLVEGPYEKYYENGALNTECTYINGKRNGLGIRYYKDGPVESKWPYQNGKLSGTAFVYWHNGIEKSIIHYSNDKKIDAICKDSTGLTIDCSAPSGGNNESDIDGVFSVAQQMPQPGYDYNGYIASHLIYPVYERNEGITGTVFISFIVEVDGTIDEVKVLKGVERAPSFDAEAVRVISSMPKWKPGIQDGEPVRVAFNIPIRFAQ